jgi:hypothetical protein
VKDIARELQRFQLGLQKTARLGCKDAKSPLIRCPGPDQGQASLVLVALIDLCPQPSKTASDSQ